ncbi:Dabb family protein [Paraburkholderia sp. CNPSo 3157]|uniref:Dabb family protein n=1 Tax=Paraburkholderia franconis TaxID=2654983 RepID=A0A7X1NJR6_9BURK|nr:Dabb family protein [Paraburkholderia franconis]MPW22956.1 Dabb family protein [Paraburkholderia franconis]
MIRHIVMWRVRGDTPAERLAASNLVKTSFEGLRGRIPGMRHLEVGLDHSQVDYACDAVLVTEFDSQEALEAYASHPEHLRVRNELGDLRTARFQVDYHADAELSSERAAEYLHAKA